MTDTVNKRGRKAIFEKRDELVRALRSIQKQEQEGVKLPSRYVQMRLADAGLVQFDTVKTGGRGRPRKVADWYDAGGALAVKALYDRGHSREELVPIAAEGEAVVSGAAHADNVAPALLGGFTVATAAEVLSLPTSIPLVACLPEIAISTRDARDVVPPDVSITDLVETVGAASTLTLGMAADDVALVGEGMSDPVVTPARAALITGYSSVESAAYDAGATGVTVSGAGPAVLAVCPRDLRRSVAAAMVRAFDVDGIDARAYQTAVGPGAMLY